MRRNLFRFHWFFLVATVILFVTELLIALFVTGFVRNYIGDILVVILIYSFIRIFTYGLQGTLPFYIFVFATLIEIAQACNVVELLSLKSESVFAIAMGNTFDWADMACYAIGAVFCYLHAKLYRH